jgi:hypothetical protein
MLGLWSRWAFLAWVTGRIRLTVAVEMGCPVIERVVRVVAQLIESNPAGLDLIQ